MQSIFLTSGFWKFEINNFMRMSLDTEKQHFLLHVKQWYIWWKKLGLYFDASQNLAVLSTKWDITELLRIPETFL